MEIFLYERLVCVCVCLCVHVVLQIAAKHETQCPGPRPFCTRASRELATPKLSR